MSACNGHLLGRSVADAGFMVADSELGDFVIENLQSAQADLAWRGDSASAVKIQINLKAAETIDTMALCLHNLTSAASVTVDLYDSRVNPALLSVTETVGGAGTIPQYKNFVMSLTSTAGVQEIDITITDTDNSDGYIQVRRLKMGVLRVPDKGFDFGYTFGFIAGEGFRAGQATWMWNSETELNDINELVRDFGVDPDKYARTRGGELLGFPDDILWIGYPESTDDRTRNQHTALIALVGADLPYKPNPVQGVFTARIEEVYYEPIVELPTAFITTWRTTGALETITLPATGTNSFVVDWGDGSSELVTTASPSHEYAVAGDYVVSIEGVCRKWYMDILSGTYQIIELNQWGNVGFTELNKGFYGANNIIFSATDSPDVSAIENFAEMFAGCVLNIDFSFVARLDVSAGTTFTGMFDGCILGTSYGVASWLIPLAGDMSLMFNGSGLTDSEYDEILIAYAAQVPFSGSPFTMGFGTAKYSAGAPATARAALVLDGISIIDGGPV